MAKFNEIWLLPTGKQQKSYTDCVRIDVYYNQECKMYVVGITHGGICPLFRRVQVPEALCIQVLDAKTEESQLEAARAVLAHMGHLELAESNGACKGAKWTGKKVSTLFAICGITA